MHRTSRVVKHLAVVANCREKKNKIVTLELNFSDNWVRIFVNLGTKFKLREKIFSLYLYNEARITKKKSLT